jgi:hypothetical protein
MKSKLQLQTLATICFLIVSLAAAPAQRSPNTAPATTPRIVPSPGQSQVPPAIDPATGLPIPQESPRWIDDEWFASSESFATNVLPNVSYDSLPISEVADNLRKQFHNEFDVLMPSGWPESPTGVFDPQIITVKLQLKNVTATEVFNAMNLLFESENTPLRWKLTANGHRPTAVLRVLPQLLPADQISPPQETMRMVYFVGDLIGTEKSGGMDMHQIVNTVSEVWEMTYGKPGDVIQFHKDAQLIIVTGTSDQIRFVEQTIRAMQKKVELEREQLRQKAAESKTKTEEPKSGSGGSK